MVEKINYKNKVLALIIRGEKIEEGLQFFTPDDYSLQVGQHKYPVGKKIQPHIHCPVKVERCESLQEVLYIQKGKVAVHFYNESGQKLDSKTLNSGDILLLREGGHGFEFLEETHMLEIKQGPYNPESRKRLEIKE